MYYLCTVDKRQALNYMVYTSDELKARIEDLQADLLFYLQNQCELSTRSKHMAMVVEKEIKELEEEIKRLKSLL